MESFPSFVVGTVTGALLVVVALSAVVIDQAQKRRDTNRLLKEVSAQLDALTGKFGWTGRHQGESGVVREVTVLAADPRNTDRLIVEYRHPHGAPINYGIDRKQVEFIG